MGFEMRASAPAENPEDHEGREAERTLLGGFPAPEDKVEALKDSQNGTEKAGWMKYWVSRLRDEGHAPPDVLRGFGADRTNEDIERLFAYVNDRVAATRHWLARQNVMSRLHEELKRIDDREDVASPEEEHVRDATYEDGTLYAVSSRGQKMRITVGDVAADRVWGLTYRPDETVPPDLWRRLRKLSAIRGTRLEIEDLQNRELSEREGVSLPTSSWSNEQIAQKPQNGVVAERMAQTMLSRIQYDRPDFGVRVEASNALEDAELKYDFKVTFPEHRRGVAIEGPPDVPRDAYVEEKRRLGIQFTTSDNKSALSHKKRQLREARLSIHDERFEEFVPKPVDDIVLVVVPLVECSDAFKKWRKAGKPPGGPELFLSEKARADMVRAIFKDRVNLSEGEIHDLLDREKPPV